MPSELIKIIYAEIAKRKPFQIIIDYSPDDPKIGYSIIRKGKVSKDKKQV